MVGKQYTFNANCSSNFDFLISQARDMLVIERGEKEERGKRERQKSMGLSGCNHKEEL